MGESTARERRGSATYATIRHAGFTPARAALELGLNARQAEASEALFLGSVTRTLGKGERMMPKFARHQVHAEAIQRAGGYPALSFR